MNEDMASSSSMDPDIRMTSGGITSSSHQVVPQYLQFHLSLEDTNHSSLLLSHLSITYLLISGIGGQALAVFHLPALCQQYILI